MENLTPQQALDILYQSARLVSLPAKDHELISQSANVLANLINPQEICEK